MKKLVLGLACAAALSAQVPLVTVSDTLRTPTGGLFSGTVGITLRYAGPLQAGGNTLTAAYQRISVAGGSFTVTLVPNDAINPSGTSYNVRFAASSGMTWEETWVVPSYPSTTTVRAVRVASAPLPAVMIAPQQINASGAQPGQALVYNGLSVGWSWIAGSGGAWGSITGVLSNQADLWAALSGKAAVSHTHAAADVTAGVFPPARLGSGTPSGTAFLRGTGAWSEVGWTDVSGKPAVFPPQSHQHAPSDITSGGATTGQVLKWNGTAWVPSADNTGGSPAWGSITGTLSSQADLQAALDSKITSPSTAGGALKYLRRNSSNTGWELNFVDWTELTGKPASYPPATHTHPLSQLQQSGAAVGQVPQWNGTAWVPANVSGGGGGPWLSGQDGAVYYNGGNVGIGTATPAQPLDVATGADFSGASVRDSQSGQPVAAMLRGNGNTGELQLFSGGQAATVLRASGNSVVAGNLGVGKVPAAALDVNGTVAAAALQGPLAWSYLTDVPSAFPPSAHQHDAADIAAGLVAPARLGTGTASSSVFLRGDQTWSAPPVASVFGRTGEVTAQSGDYTAAQVASMPSGSLEASTVQDALNELDAEKAPVSHLHSVSDLTQSGATAGQVLQWNGSAWTPASLPSAVNYSQSFSSQTSVALTHGSGTADVIVACYDSAGQEIIPQSVVLTDADTVTVGFGSAMSGKCVVNRGGGGGSGNGTVTSVGLSMPGGFTVTGSPVTAAGTLTVTTALSGVVRAVGGAFTTVTGNASDCVKVDGTSGPCGSGGGTVYTGAGLTGDGSAANPVRVDPAGGVASQLFYSASIDFPAIAAASCAEESIAAAGVTAGMTLAPGWPATLPMGLTGMMYSGSGVIVVRLCNVTGASINPSSAVFSARAIGGF